MDFFSTIVGFLAGIGTNVISWWFLSHVIKPNIEFSPNISKLPTSFSENDRSGYRYRIKISNGGRRGVIDVELGAILRIEGLRRKNNIEVISIPLTSDGDKIAKIIRLSPVKSGNRKGKIHRLQVNMADNFRTNVAFSEDIREKANKKELALEDVMSLGNRAWLQLSAFGYDEFSGARKLFLSKKYTLADIKDGIFELNTLNIAESPTVESDYNKENNIYYQLLSSPK